ncbi:MAG: hypothetical protein WBA29_11735, partial [Xanthobacteraceae bacterium]
HQARADTLREVTDWFAGICGNDSANSQLQRAQQWAHAAAFGSPDSPRIKGFGLAGFQYLRMLFGGNTTKPDTHIIRFVENAIGMRATPAKTLYFLERAACRSAVSLRDFDTTTWENSARLRTR